MNDYDDWFEENAPCSSESSRRSRLRSSNGWIVEYRPLPLRWMLIAIPLLFAALVIGFASGCSNNRTVFVPEASPMRVGPDTRAKVWLLINGQWEISGNRIVIPEGWYLVPPSYVEDEE